MVTFHKEYDTQPPQKNAHNSLTLGREIPKRKYMWKRFIYKQGMCLKITLALAIVTYPPDCQSKMKPTHTGKQRLIVTTDLGGTDPDDTQSLIHLLLCSNTVDIEGLVSSQVWIDTPDKADKIREVVKQFGPVLPRLKKHAAGYPDENYLLSSSTADKRARTWTA